MSKDDLDERFTAFLKSITPAEQEKLAKQVGAMMKEDVEFDRHIERHRRKGLKEPDEMVFEVKFTVMCTTCGAHHITRIKSSNTKDIVHGQPLCGKCYQTLMSMTLEDVVKTLIEKEKVWHARKHLDHEPVYVPACERVYEEQIYHPLPGVAETVEELDALFEPRIDEESQEAEEE